MQVAMIQFWSSGGNQGALLWNLQTPQTANYNDLLENILTMQRPGGNNGRIEPGFQLALDNIIGSASDRATARNVVLTLGDGAGSATGISNLNNMITRNDRYETILCKRNYNITT